MAQSSSSAKADSQTEKRNTGAHSLDLGVINQPIQVVPFISSPKSVGSGSGTRTVRPPVMTADALLSNSNLGMDQPHVISPTRAARYPYWNSGQRMAGLPVVYASPSILPLNQSSSFATLNKGDSSNGMNASQSLSMRTPSIQMAVGAPDAMMAPMQMPLLPPEQHLGLDLGDSIMYCDSPSLMQRRSDSRRLSASLEHYLRAGRMQNDAERQNRCESQSVIINSDVYSPLQPPSTQVRQSVDQNGNNNDDVPELDHTARPPRVDHQESEQVRILGFPFDQKGFMPSNRIQLKSVEEASFMTLSNANTVTSGVNGPSPVTPMENCLSQGLAPLQPLNELDNLLESCRLFFLDMDSIRGVIHMDLHNILTSAFNTAFNASRLFETTCALCVKSIEETGKEDAQLVAFLDSMKANSAGLLETFTSCVEMGDVFKNSLNKKLRLLLVTRDVNLSILRDLTGLLGAPPISMPHATHSTLIEAPSRSVFENAKSQTHGWADTSINSRGSALSPFTGNVAIDSVPPRSWHMDPATKLTPDSCNIQTINSNRTQSDELATNSIDAGTVSVLNSAKSQVNNARQWSTAELLSYLSKSGEVNCHLDGELPAQVRELRSKEVEIALLLMIVSHERKVAPKQEKTAPVTGGNEPRSSLTTDFPHHLASCQNEVMNVGEERLRKFSRISSVMTYEEMEKTLEHFKHQHDWMEICEWYHTIPLFTVRDCDDRHTILPELKNEVQAIVNETPSCEELLDLIGADPHAKSMALEQLEIAKAEVEQVFEEMQKLAKQVSTEVIRCIMLDSMENEITGGEEVNATSIMSETVNADNFCLRLKLHQQSIEASIYTANAFYHSIQSCASQLERFQEVCRQLEDGVIPESKSISMEETHTLQSLSRYVYSLVNTVAKPLSITSSEMTEEEEKTMVAHMRSCLAEVGTQIVRLLSSAHHTIKQAETELHSGVARSRPEESQTPTQVGGVRKQKKRTVQEIIQKSSDPSPQSLARLYVSFTELNTNLERTRASLLKSTSIFQV
ncbi:hypothetical protein, conserved [Angomonas deanei]|uniref:Uncharacterized protein n=1 Tax=Angomonas deanei TaxID=59799 RepID=A0A7G2C7I1_9TRYP|nr:hypothetical protein, conserved [Angomonas deanei]